GTAQGIPGIAQGTPGTAQGIPGTAKATPEPRSGPGPGQCRQSRQQAAALRSTAAPSALAQHRPREAPGKTGKYRKNTGKGRGTPGPSGRGSAPPGAAVAARRTEAPLPPARGSAGAAVDGRRPPAARRDRAHGREPTRRDTHRGEGRTAKALKSLQFANPGRQTEFTPETSKREKRRQTKISVFNSDRQVIPAKSKVYDSQGLLLYSGMDLCDCLDEDCLGCFYACPKCGSNKCGTECRCDRKWLYEQIEIEGGEIIRNKHAG
uniref:ARF like GTPase 14 effector protein n=1 Tax=Taeniopygia guttata TaxID=59729 RepID=A0A674HC35_TAEGU